ncbi:hypothetical protein ABIC71_001930 [Herbaspirillum seropedicae]|uniref:hypothetical protein n=1 Tax=Herbaspirillum seropedicae TaxID=964 RepID=UPI00339A27BA
MYDFMTDHIPDGERVPYKVIRWWLLSCYYSHCRSKINGMNRRGDTWDDGERELGYAYEQFEFAYQMPLEIFMLEQLTLILDAGEGSPVFYEYHCSRMKKILRESNIPELITYLPEDERREFLSDLALLKRNINVDEEVRSLIREDGQIEIENETQYSTLAENIQESFLRKICKMIKRVIG